MTGRHRVDQIVAGLADGDAISNEVIELKKVLRRLGAESEIYAVPNRVTPRIASECKPLSDCRTATSDVAVHHYAIASEATEVFLSCPGRKVLLYHNITPAEYFAGFDDGVAHALQEARQNLKRVALQSDAVWAVSEFNASELKASGINDVKVFPLMFTPTRLDMPPDPAVLRKFAEPMKNILFVGRIAPNKCVEELITAFACYHKTMNPFSRLIIVGSERSAPRYFAMLRMLAGEYNLPNICFEYFASPSGLVTYYELADVFVSTSRHEGYCLPLVEAMYKHVPVIARSAGGTPEAMGGGGVMFDDLQPTELAELIHRVLSDPQLQDEILTSQEERMQSIRVRNVDAELKALLSPLAQGI